MYPLPELQTPPVDLMRHGEPVGGRRYRGHLDDPLSDKGWRQMRAAVGEHHPWDAVVSSPLCRCADFGAELAQRHGLPLQIEPRFKEIGFGAWEGRSADELQAQDPLCLWRFYDDPLNNTPPGAEPLAAFRDLARELNVWLLAGSLTVTVDGERVANRSLLIDAAGNVVARYDKIHMFDVDLPGGETYRESATFRPGDAAVVAEAGRGGPPPPGVGGGLPGRAGAPPASEGRRYEPHLTLARCRVPADVRTLVATLADFTGTPWTASEIYLIRSRPQDEPRYETIGTWPLRARAASLPG